MFWGHWSFSALLGSRCCFFIVVGYLPSSYGVNFVYSCFVPSAIEFGFQPNFYYFPEKDLADGHIQREK
jgi:hypothetical protein